MDSAVVNQNVVHFEVCRLASLLIFELDECVLQRVARLFVPDHLTPNKEGIYFRVFYCSNKFCWVFQAYFLTFFKTSKTEVLQTPSAKDVNLGQGAE